jgi:hypothetical protein
VKNRKGDKSTDNGQEKAWIKLYKYATVTKEEDKLQPTKSYKCSQKKKKQSHINSF